MGMTPQYFHTTPTSFTPQYFHTTILSHHPYIFHTTILAHHPYIFHTTIHGHSKQWGWSGFDPTTFSLTKCARTPSRAVSENGCPTSCRFHWQKGNVALGFSTISVYSMAIPYCDDARGRAACGMSCWQLSLYTRNLKSLVSFPRPRPAFHRLQAVRTASIRKLHALSYVQSATTSQRVRVATIEILFAKNCKTWDLGPKTGIMQKWSSSI